MAKIIIKDFGPIKSVELELKQFIVFIGPQASGKSTISKSIYFFKSIRNDVLKYLIESIDTGEFNKPMGNISKRIRAKFLNFFGPTAHARNFYLEYNFGNNKRLKINLKGKYINPKFNDNFEKEFFTILNEIKKTIPKGFSKNYKFLSSSELLKLEQEKKNILDALEEKINKLFEDDKDLLFIPAGRSLLTTLSDQLQYIHPHKLDYLMQSFIARINNTKPLFNKSLNDLIEDKKYLTYDTINDYVTEAKKIIEQILKAKYINDTETEKLYVAKDKYVKINFSSSGQQESIWILNLIFISLLNNNKLFIVFEEPEAHLYPKAQKEIIDLIAIIFNALNAQIILTTHSPYILSSINNLVYADIIMKKGIKIDKVLNPKTIIDCKKIDTFFVDNGKIKSIIDEETDLIEIEAIDSASEIINDTFNKLFDLDK